jgi:hypothetical protein
MFCDLRMIIDPCMIVDLCMIVAVPWPGHRRPPAPGIRGVSAV